MMMITMADIYLFLSRIVGKKYMDTFFFYSYMKELVA